MVVQRQWGNNRLPSTSGVQGYGGAQSFYRCWAWGLTEAGLSSSPATPGSGDTLSPQHCRGQGWCGAGPVPNPGPGKTHKGPLKCCPAPHNRLYSCLRPPEPGSCPRGPARRQPQGRVPDAAPCVWHGCPAICPSRRQRQLQPGPGHSPAQEGAFAPGCPPPASCCLLTPCLLLPSHLLLPALIPPGWKGLNPILTRAATAQHRGNATAHPNTPESTSLLSCP